MKSKTRFLKEIIGSVHREKIIGIRAGSDSAHRIIGIWAVVVEGRVFVRSWGMKPRSWWRTLLDDPYGLMTVGTQEFSIRAIQTRSERLKDLVSAAYKEKYNTPGSIQYIKDLSGKRSRDTTTELVMC